MEQEISRTRALAIAETECRQRGWPWLEPIRAENTPGGWVIRTNTGARGANARIIVSQEDGQVVEAVYLPR